MSYKTYVSILSLPLLLIVNSFAVAEEVAGYKSVMIGHSFFIPVAEKFQEVIEEVNNNSTEELVSGHTQANAFKGGNGGAPGVIWYLEEGADARDELMALNPEDENLLGLTYYPGEGVAVSDYQLWIDFAREDAGLQDITVFIGSPWPKFPETTEAYREGGLTEQETVHSIIDELRSIYDNNTIIEVPYGVGVVDLVMDMPLSADNVTEVVAEEDDNGDYSLFADQLGHGHRPFKRGAGANPKQMVHTLAALEWLSAIYQVDVTQINYETGFNTDLKQRAQDVVSNEPYAQYIRYPANPSNILLDFENGIPEDVAFEIANGQWQIHAGKLETDASGSNSRVMLASDMVGSGNYSIKADIENISSDDEANWQVGRILARYVDNQNFYSAFVSGNGQVVLKEVVDGSNTI